MRSKEVDKAIELLHNEILSIKEGLEKGWYYGERYNLEQEIKKKETVLNYISELEKIVDVMKPSEIAYRIKLAENYFHKDEIRAIKEECEKEGCCSDELKEYYDNKCVRICKYYEVCTRVDKLLGE